MMDQGSSKVPITIRRNVWRVVATTGFRLAVGLGLLTACNDEDQLVPTAERVVESCGFEVPAGRLVECGSIAVPQAWETPGRRDVSVFFAIVRSLNPDRKPDPVVILNGGPGQSGTELVGTAWDRMADLLRYRDLIFVDQRGTGFSKPALHCPNLDPVAYFHGGLTAADAEMCRKPLKQANYDLANFNTLESARDLAALRRALGLISWNLHGTSYGTILAMEAVRNDPGGVRSVVLNSPNLTRASWLDINRMAEIQGVYKRLFADCRADPGCNASYPALESVFLDLASRMERKPLVVTYTDPRTGAVGTAEMTFRSLLDILTILVGSGESAGQVPSLLWHLHEVAQGLTPPSMPLLAWLYMPAPYWDVINKLAYGLNAAIGCREVRPWVDAESARVAASLYYPYVMASSLERDYDVFCPVWKLPPAAESLRNPVESDVPTLILTGAYDTLTPTHLAEIVAKTLPRSRILRFSGLGHDVYAASDCAQKAVADFVGNPGTTQTYPCVAQTTRPTFALRPASAVPARCTAADCPP